MNTNLRRVKSNDLCGPAATLGKLLSHRMFTLEPIRFMAMRNQRAMHRAFRAARQRANQAGRTASARDIAADVTAAILDEQGIENTEQSRDQLAMAHHYPFEVGIILDSNHS